MFAWDNQHENFDEACYLLMSDAETLQLAGSVLIRMASQYPDVVFQQYLDRPLHSFNSEVQQRLLFIGKQLLNASLCGEGSPMGITAIRINECNLEVQFNENPLWVSVGDISECTVPGEDGADGITPQPVWNESALAWDLDNDGTEDTPFTELRGNTGPQGATGPQGEPGVDGQNGVCECDNQPEYTPTPNEGETFDEIACRLAGGLATYLTREFHQLVEDFRSLANAGEELSNIFETFLSSIPIIGPAVDNLLDLLTDIADNDAIELVQLTDEDFEEGLLCAILCEMRDRIAANGFWSSEDTAWIMFDVIQPWAFGLAPGGASITFYGQIFSLFIGALSSGAITQRMAIFTTDDPRCALCDSCDAGEYFEPFTDGVLQEFTTILKGNISLDGGQGESAGSSRSISTLYNGKWFEENDISIDFGVNRNIVSIEIDVYAQVTNPIGTDFLSSVVKIFDINSVQQFSQQQNASEGGWTTLVYSPGVNGSRITFEVTGGAHNAAQTGQTRVDNIRIVYG